MLGQRLKTARLSLHLSQKNLGKILGVGQKQVSDYENGKGGLSVEQVSMLESRVSSSQQISGSLPPGKREIVVSLEDIDFLRTILDGLKQPLALSAVIHLLECRQPPFEK